MPGIHHDWGVAPYARVHGWMERLVEERALGRLPNLLLTGEHEAVITLGRKTPPGAAYPPGVPVLEVERGGEATWHGPGQLVAYPIVHLTQARRDLHRFQRDLEEVGIATLADFGIEGHRREGLTGVWVGARKVQSLGIAVRRWVTWHGLALNVNCALSGFASFSPCGLDGAVMASMAACLGREVSLPQVRDRLVAHAGRLLPGGPFLPARLEQPGLPGAGAGSALGAP